MKVYELSKKLNTKNKDLIAFFKDNGYDISNHMQSLKDDEIQFAESNYSFSIPTPKEETPSSKKVMPQDIVRTYNPNDVIPCRSVVPWKIVETGIDQITLYRWNAYGDVEYITYKDLQYLRRRSIFKEGQVLIEDDTLCELWKKDLSGAYKKYLNVTSPEEFFDLDDDKFKEILSKAPKVFGDVIKHTVMSMIHEENYPSLNKIAAIDEICGTSIKEFI
jgi:hypothetical protein